MVMQCPNDTTVAADLGVNFTVVTWPPVIINDNVDVTTLDMSHANGSIFYIGSVNVSYQASDLAGNTASCNFTVTVIGKSNFNGKERRLECCRDALGLRLRLSRVLKVFTSPISTNFYVKRYQIRLGNFQ